MLKVCWVDIESTGLDKNKHGIIEIAGMIEIDKKIVEEFEFKIGLLPGKEIDPKSLEVNGISEYELLNGEYVRNLNYQPEFVKNKLIAIFDKYFKTLFSREVRPKRSTDTSDRESTSKKWSSRNRFFMPWLKSSSQILSPNILLPRYSFSANCSSDLGSHRLAMSIRTFFLLQR